MERQRRTRKRLGFDLGLFFQLIWRSWREPNLTDQVAQLLGRPALPAPPPSPAPEKKPTAAAPPPAPPPPPKPQGEAWSLLALMQREGRLVDFLMEEIAGFEDAQIGAAVRDIHDQCRKALLEHGEFVAVVDRNEDESYTVAAGFDPAAIKLTGNLQGQPPFTGTVRHRGWKVREKKLPPLPAAQNGYVLQPAEVELA
ncbi:MAG TPA: DUF2760 domain-containing protein [Phenylobacterium sp.]|nr:DUF2760 domain-containing protein [Phenylobacterium sp.]HMP59220.1 DUF2760 domain-containing protein [Gemmatales bacterium]